MWDSSSKSIFDPQLSRWSGQQTKVANRKRKQADMETGDDTECSEGVVPNPAKRKKFSKVRTGKPGKLNIPFKHHIHTFFLAIQQIVGSCPSTL